MEEVKRIRYFENEFLDSADFETEQDYHRMMRYRHTRYFHTWGIGHGLEVKRSEGFEPGKETKITVYPGIALDREGKDIVLAASKNVDFIQPGFVGGQSYYITIRWNEQQGLPRQENELKRWEETPFIDAVVDKPLEPDINLVLARVTLREDRSIEFIDVSNKQRKDAAHKVGNYTVTSAKIAQADQTSGQDIHRGEGIKTDHIQDEAVTSPKLGPDVKEKLHDIETQAKEYVDKILVGTVAAFAMNIPPDGWFECNGQAVSRKEHARLFDRIMTKFGGGDGMTTFNVPDLRGEFIRGWDGGSLGSKGTDPDREKRKNIKGDIGNTIGSYQDDALQGHRHNFEGTKTTIEGGSHQHLWAKVGDAHLAAPHWTEGNNVSTHHPRDAYTDSAEHSHEFTPSGSITNPTLCRIASESRPKNICLMYCIKY